jgi:2-oxoglutarate dehydrogenase E2 component (dihydrolipoamide succinyltransferase)
MTIEVKVPVLPESIADATIATWHKKIGDRVSRDENILDLETDKVVLEVPAPADGVLTAQHFKVGDTVQTGQVLASLDNTASAAAPQVAPKTDVAEVKSDTLPSPVVRRLLAEHHVAPSAIQGTGKDGRLTKEDVLAFVAHHRTEPTKTSTPEAKIPVATMGAREERRVPMWCLWLTALYTYYQSATNRYFRNA